MSRFARRALLRAVVSAVLAWALAGRRPAGTSVAAVAGAAVGGAAQELPWTALPGALAGSIALTRTAPRAGPVAAGLGVGVGVSLALRRVWPVAPRTPAQIRRTHTHVSSRPSPDGAGLTVVVNASAGPAGQADLVEQLRERVPAATIIEVGEGGDLADALRVASEADVLGIAGGDGSINAAAGVAGAAGKPLLVIPAGTLNHFARDLGVEGIDDALTALFQGDAVAIDTGTIDGKPFLNTASFGTYSDLVDAREALEETIGKWPALVVGLVRLLRDAAPMEVVVDGRSRRIWMVFVGNCLYSPPGFAPAWREHLDDGLLDVRLVDGGRPFARAKLLAAVLTGRLATSTVYEAFTATQLEVRCVGEPLRLARDGETFDGSPTFTIAKGPPIVVYAPPPA